MLSNLRKIMISLTIVCVAGLGGTGCHKSQESRTDQSLEQHNGVGSQDGESTVNAELLKDLKGYSDPWGFVDDNDNTLLILAAKAGDLATIKEAILSHDADINQGNKWGITPLIQAIISGHSEIVPALIKECSANVNLPDYYLKTPLMYALDYRAYTLVKILIEAGADVNARQQDGKTPLMFSHSPVNTKRLLEAGADPFCLDSNGKSVLHYAENAEILKILLEDAHVISRKDNTGVLPEALARNVEMSKLYDEQESSNAYYRSDDKVHEEIFMSLCGPQPRKIFVDEKKIAYISILNKDNDKYIQSLVEATGEKYVGYDERLKIDSDHKLTVYVQNDLENIKFHHELMKKYGFDMTKCRDKNGRTPLMVAAMAQNAETFMYLLENGVDVNAKLPDGTTALHLAAHQLPEVVDALIKKNADVNARTTKNETPLMIAVANGHKEAAQSLLDAGADADVQLEDGRVALHFAAEYMPEFVDALVKKKINVNAVKSRTKETALMIAVEHENTDAVKSLLAAGADPNIAKTKSIHALYLASVEGYTDIVKLLLAAGADVNATNYQNKTALMAASSWLHSDISKLLLEAKADPNLMDEEGNSALKFALEAVAVNDEEIAKKDEIVSMIRNATKDTTQAPDTPPEKSKINLALAYSKNRESDKPQPELIKKLIESGADINSKNDKDQTALYLASLYGDLENVKLLIAAGADVNLASKNGVTPLGVSCGNPLIETNDEIEKNRGEITKALLAAGANPNFRSDDAIIDNTILHGCENVDSVRALLAAGADVNAKNEDEKIPIMNDELDPEIIRLMIKAGADVHVIDKDQDIPYFFEVKSPAVLDAFLSGGVNINEVIGDNKYLLDEYTSLHYAVERTESAWVVQRMIEAGANVNAVEQHGETPLEKAVSHNKNTLVKLLLKAGAEFGSSILEVAACSDVLSRVMFKSTEPVIDSLIKAGADVHVKFNRSSLLDCSLDYIDYPAVRRLVLAGVDVGNHLDKVMDMSFSYGDVQMVTFLAPMFDDKTSVKANSLVVKSSEMGSISVLKALLEAGFSPNATFEEKSALTAALSAEAVKTLLQYGADPNLADPKGKAPLENAHALHLESIEKVLKDAGAK